MKCKLALDQSVLSTLQRGGEGQNAYKMKFPTLVTKVVFTSLALQCYAGLVSSGFPSKVAKM